MQKRILDLHSSIKLMLACLRPTNITETAMRVNNMR